MSSAQVGRSSITPATWPEASVPRSMRPSIMLARSIIGVFAAISTCDHDSPCDRRMAVPSRTRSSHEAPDTRRN
ncbi:MAG TPA: hypothetical protein VKU39_20260 [Streptosporangiaceae bacterium]|nr:hypothetical protein [Streptosporangiaceae bacterium]